MEVSRWPAIVPDPTSHTGYNSEHPREVKHEPSDTPIWPKHPHPHSAPHIVPQPPRPLSRWPRSSLAQLTIHSTEPEGCSKGWAPLHRVFTVARPKSPIFTVSPSCRKMSTRVKGHYRSSQEPHLPS